MGLPKKLQQTENISEEFFAVDSEEEKDFLESLLEYEAITPEELKYL